MIKPTIATTEAPDYQAGTLLLVDKPKGWTSFDVVNKIRYALRYRLGVKKIKVGHAGTLDPMATGLLLICTGKFTKQLHSLQGMDKRYTGVIRLGETTPSYDAETTVDQAYPTDHISRADIEQQRMAMLGEQMQIPPMFSAIKVDGQPLYKKARKGQTLTRDPRPVIIREFEISHVEMPNVFFHVLCSKGTYIRSLAYDFGRALESGAYLSALRRTAIGPYPVEQAWELMQLVSYIRGEPLN